jgi:TP901 family phage tail tape measure protein
MGKSMKKSGAMMTSAGRTMTKAITLPLLGIAAAAVDVNLKFERSMSLIQTQAGASAKETKYLRGEVLKLSQASKFGPDEVAKALFRVRSAGYKGAKGVHALTEGIKLATVGNSDLEMTTKALVGAAKSLDIHGSKAFNHLAAEMNATVGTGDMRMEELQGALSTGVLPAFVAAGLGMRDYSSALTVMTDRNVPAIMASTRLRTAITMLVPHTKKAEEALGGIGIKSETLANIMRHKGLPEAIKYLAEHLDKLSANEANRVQIEAFGGAKSSATIEMLTQNYQELFEKEQLVGKGIHKYAAEVKAAEENPLVELQRAWANIQVDLVKIGKVIVPIVVPAFIAVAGAIGSAADAFAHLSHGNQATVLAILATAAAIGPLLRLFGYLTTQTGSLILWLERNNMVLGQNTIETQAAATANAELAASIAGVITAQKELLIANSSGVVTGSVPVAATAATTVESGGMMAGARGAATGFAGGLAKMLPMALAVVGIGNIVKSAVEGDSKAALYKAGGAAAGGIVGGIVGGLPGAMVGSGIGSILGGMLNSMISDTKLTGVQEMVQRQAHHAAEAVHSQRDAVKGLHSAENNLAAATKRHHAATKQASRAHEHLNAVIKKFGPASAEARKAEHELSEMQHRDQKTAEGAAHAHRLSGHALADYRHRTLLVVASEKARLPGIEAQVNHLNHKYDVEKKRGKENWQLLHRLVGKENEEGKVRSKIQNDVAEAAHVGGKKFARALREIGGEQAALGRHFRGITIGAKHVKEGMEEFATSGTLANKRFAASASKGSIIFHEDAVKIAESSGIATRTIEKRLGAALQKMGVSAVQFGFKNKSEHKGNHQAGGMIVPGNTSGDKVPMTAMVEPHEVVHILNSRASKDMRKLGALENLNNNRPRFAEGGVMGMGAALSKAKEINSQQFPYVWGGGHGSFVGPYDCSGAVSAVLNAAGLLQKPMVSGELASWGSPGSGPITVYANAVHAFMKIAGRFFGTSGSNPGGGAGWFPSSIGMGEVSEGDSGGPFNVRHAAGMTGLVSQIKELEMTGPDGAFKSLAQGSINKQTTAANKYLKSHTPGKWGGGDSELSLKGIGGSVASEAAQIVKRAHAEYVPALALFEALWAESSMGASAPGNVLQGLGSGGAPIMDAASEISGFLTGHPTWTGRSAMEQHSKNPSLPANAIAQIVQASGVGEGNEGRANYLLQKDRAIATMKQFGLFSGGGGEGEAGASSINNLMKKKKKKPIGRSIENVLKGLAKGKHQPKYKGQLKKLHRRIDGVGLDKAQLGRLGDLTKEAEKFGEYATSASSLSITNEEGETTQGNFANQGEGYWLNKQLSSLLAMRREVIATHEKIQDKYMPRVQKLLKDAKGRLLNVRAAIRKAEQEKKALEKKIKDIEAASNQTKQAIEQEVHTMEHQIAEARRQPTPKGKAAAAAQTAKINQMERNLESKKNALAHSGAEGTSQIKAIKEHIQKIQGEQASRSRVEQGLVQNPMGIIPSLESKQTGLRETAANLFGGGGEVKKIPFIGLQQIQGVGGPTEQIKGIPAIGTLGPEVLTVQQRLREIGEEAAKVKTPSTPGETELASVEREIAETWRSRYLTSQSQFGVLSNFPSVQALGAVPFAGSFAKGGALAAGHSMAWVGEHGPEPIFAPQGSRVLPAHEATAALKGSRHHELNFEEVHFHEADGKVTGKVNGQSFEKDVRKITRKDASGAAKPSPGSKRRR